MNVHAREAKRLREFFVSVLRKNSHRGLKADVFVGRTSTSCKKKGKKSSLKLSLQMFLPVKGTVVSRTERHRIFVGTSNITREK